MISWLMTMMTDDTRECPRCRRSYPASYEACPWCDRPNEEF